MTRLPASLLVSTVLALSCQPHRAGSDQEIAFTLSPDPSQVALKVVEVASQTGTGHRLTVYSDGTALAEQVERSGQVILQTSANLPFETLNDLVGTAINGGLMELDPDGFIDSLGRLPTNDPSRLYLEINLSSYDIGGRAQPPSKTMILTGASIMSKLHPGVKELQAIRTILDFRSDMLKAARRRQQQQ